MEEPPAPRKLVPRGFIGYGKAVTLNSIGFARHGRWLALFLVFSITAGFGADKSIRLRNQLLVPPDKPASPPQNLAVAPPASGLYLIQFTNRVQPDWRADLAQAGVQLLWYVPEDCFVARLSQVNLGELRNRPFVRYVGEYRPEHKVHTELAPAGLVPADNAPLKVSVLVSSKVTAPEWAAMRRIMPLWERVSHTRAGPVIHGQASRAQVQLLAKSSAVLWIERAARPRLYDEIATKIVAGNDGSAGTRALVHQLGFDGSGVTVAVPDSGLHNGDAATMHPDLAGRTPAFYHYGALTGAADEHSHGTHVAGIIAGNGAVGEKDENGFLYGLGVAPGARIVAQRIFDGAGNYEAPPSFAALTRDALRAGAEIASNSWGDDTQGRYDLSAMEFDALVRDADDLAFGDQPFILEFSAGNAGPGPQTIGSPAVAKNVIATGASQNDRPDLFIYADGIETMADFSSRGPCEDGRIKPDVVAPGTWIASLKSASATDENAWSPISDSYLYMGGTSQAGPHASGAAAVFLQYYRLTHTNQTPSPALVKAVLINCAVNMDDTIETEPAPNNDEGWGRIDLTQIIGADRRYDYVDQSARLITGQTFERRVIISSRDEPLKVTLAYTDVPALPAAIPALVNDLDLEVIAPDGRRYHGNQFLDGESVPDASAFDRLNNVEGVFISDPQPGEYIIRVHAFNVAMDALLGTQEVDQDFALVTSGAVPMPGAGSVFLDRRAYTAPSQIRLQLYDSDLAGQPTVPVVLRSGSETAGETITLRASGSAGLFTGTVATATGMAATDGRLQIKHGDLIEAVYTDQPGGALRIATANADFVPPVISSVSDTNQYGRRVVSWFTDEPAGGIVRFGTNSTYAFAVTNTVALTSHALILDGLVAGATYQYFVVATDEAGNVRTNNNGGAGFSFLAAPPATVLIVDSYAPDVLGGTLSIPLASYTAALDQLGISYEVWDAVAGGSPQFTDLRPFQVVIWRINDSFWMATDPYSTLSAQQQSAITNYLAHGGSFFLSSMEICSRLGATPFRTNVLQVRQFVTKPDPFSPCPTCDEDCGVPTVAGASGDPVAGGLALDLDYSNYPEEEFLGIGPDLGDTFTPTTNSSAILLDTTSLRAAGVRYPRTGADSTGRVVFLSFPLDTVSDTAPAPNNRANLLRNVLGFLAPGLNGLGTVALDSGHYSVPSLVTIEVGDSDLIGQGPLTATLHSSTDTNGVLVSLTETPRRGLFRGHAALIHPTNSPAPGKLRAADGDTLTAEYLDASGNVVVKATASVDTQRPAISGVLGTPDFEDITVTWTTSELTDALVQYGESPSQLDLTRTAYSDELDTEHELLLPGLAPDRLYYFQVVSRDAAGNTVVDDNGGQLYQARTLKPLAAPFTDHFDLANTNWTTYDGEESLATWQLGVPNNGQENAAHSPPNAWGSNLRADYIDYADTFLISPAIQLAGGNRATLRFWHSYDFTEQTSFDILEGGVVYLFTNRNAQPLTLAEFGYDQEYWNEVELDLTPYLGSVIYLVWHYQLLSLESANRAGWLVDDVSVEITNVIPGTIVVSNNLAQAGFVLTGPINRTGYGRIAVYSNAPPGEYRIQFADVPHYLTPPAQTNTLQSNQVLDFNGIYTLVDANQNGIADSWEQQYFGSAAAGRPGDADTDGDGLSDLAEFIAGTNPTNAASVFALNKPVADTNQNVRLTWSAVPGREYRLLGSSNVLDWFTLQDWTRAGSGLLGVTLSPRTNGPSLMLQLQVRP